MPCGSLSAVFGGHSWRAFRRTVSISESMGLRPARRDARSRSHHSAVEWRRARSARGRALGSAGQSCVLEAIGTKCGQTADEQTEFMVKLQRLLDETLFVASYKFALLLALADLSV